MPTCWRELIEWSHCMTSYANKQEQIKKSKKKILWCRIVHSPTIIILSRNQEENLHSAVSNRLQEYSSTQLCLCFLNELLMSNVFELTIKNRFQFSATKRTTQQCVHSENEFVFANVQNHGISLIFLRFISAFYLVLRSCDYYRNILYYIPVTYSRPAAAVKLYCALTFYLQWRVAEFVHFLK